MTTIQDLWKTVNRRVGKVEQALLLGAVATVIAVPIAVAGPQGSPNLATTPTTTGTSTSGATTRVVTVSSTFTLTLSPGSSVQLTANVGGHTISIMAGVTGSGPATVVVTKDGLTISAPNGLKLGQELKLEGLPPGLVTVTATILESPTFGPLERAGSLSYDAANGAGRTVTFTATVGPDGMIQVPASLQGVTLSSLSIVEGATTAANGSGTTATGGASGAAQVPGKVPTGLPSTGAGGMAS